MLTIADGGGRGVQEPLILADVICEQPLMLHQKKIMEISKKIEGSFNEKLLIRIVCLM